VNQRSRRVLAPIAAALAFVVATACLTGTAGAKPASGDPIKLGNVELYPKGTGGVETPGQAVNAYIDDWNKRGGLNGQPIDYIQEYPTGLDPAAYIAAVTKLVTVDKVVALPGFGNCQYTINTLRQYRIPSWGATTNPPCGNHDDFMFSGAIVATPVLAPFKYAIDHGSKAFAVLRPPFDQLKQYWEIPVERYLKRHPEVKTKLVDLTLPFAPTAADLDAAILTMKQQGVDAVFAGAVPDAVLAIKEANIQGKGPKDGVKWFFGPTNYTPQTAEVPDLDGVYTSNPAYPWEDTKNPDVKTMIKVLKGKVDVRDGFAQYGYQEAGFLENSLKGIKGKITSASILKQWKKDKKVPYPLTPMKFDVRNGFESPAGGVTLQVKNGAWVPVSDFIVVPYKEFAP
jgi:branched-chain amino acid transport system substrate-binding protein